MEYAEGFKSRMVKRMAGPEGISATALAEEVGISQSTLSRWLRGRSVEAMKSEKSEGATGSSTRGRWTGEERLRIVVEAAVLSGEDLGAFLRREGLHDARLQEWRAAVIQALDAPKKRGSNRRSPEQERLRALERELLRKDKALAEVAALLVLKKRIEEIWGDEGDSTPTRRGT